MDIVRGNLYCQNDTVNIAGGMCFIGQLLLVVALDKQPAVWVGSAFYCGSPGTSGMPHSEKLLPQYGAKKSVHTDAE